MDEQDSHNIAPETEVEPAPAGGNHAVPWTARDAWFGLGWMLILSVLMFFFFWLLVEGFSLDLSLELMLVLGETVFVLPVWWFTFHKYRTRWRELGFRAFKPSELLAGLGLSFAAFVIMAVYAAIILEVFDTTMQPDTDTIEEEMRFPWLLAVMTVLAAPLVEEIFFRGFLFAGFRQRYGWQKAALISSVIFAAGHLQPFAILPLFMFGYVFAYMYHRSRSLWVPILLHFALNLWGVVGEFIVSE